MDYGIDREGRSGVYVEFGTDIPAVCRHGVGRQEKGCGYLLCGQASGYAAHDLALARRQLLRQGLFGIAVVFAYLGFESLRGRNENTVFDGTVVAKFMLGADDIVESRIE